jgi:hypothetical protein
MDQLALTPAALAEMLALIEDNTISGKIGKEVLPDLLQVGGRQMRLCGGACWAHVWVLAVPACGSLPLAASA